MTTSDRRPPLSLVPEHIEHQLTEKDKTRMLLSLAHPDVWREAIDAALEVVDVAAGAMAASADPRPESKVMRQFAASLFESLRRRIAAWKFDTASSQGGPFNDAVALLVRERAAGVVGRLRAAYSGQSPSLDEALAKAEEEIAGLSVAP